jgi:hypothetical protein
MLSLWRHCEGFQQQQAQLQASLPTKINYNLVNDDSITIYRDYAHAAGGGYAPFTAFLGRGSPKSLGAWNIVLTA